MLNRAGIYPCGSYNDAKATLQKILNNRINDSEELRDEIIEATKKYHLTIPEDYEQRVTNHKKELMQSRINNAQNHLEDLKKQLESL